MLTSLITLLIVALVLWIVWQYVLGAFVKGQPHTIIGIVFGLILLIYALKLFGVVVP